MKTLKTAALCAVIAASVFASVASASSIITKFHGYTLSIDNLPDGLVKKFYDGNVVCYTTQQQVVSISCVKFQ
jgi:hypothetical protein